jgi:hypothetical protein
LGDRTCDFANDRSFVWRLRTIVALVADRSLEAVTIIENQNQNQEDYPTRRKLPPEFSTEVSVQAVCFWTRELNEKMNQMAFVILIIWKKKVTSLQEVAFIHRT